jgi:hypothetical protein
MSSKIRPAYLLIRGQASARCLVDIRQQTTVDACHGVHPADGAPTSHSLKFITKDMSFSKKKTVEGRVHLGLVGSQDYALLAVQGRLRRLPNWFAASAG